MIYYYLKEYKDGARYILEYNSDYYTTKTYDDFLKRIKEMSDNYCNRVEIPKSCIKKLLSEKELNSLHYMGSINWSKT